MNDMNSAPATNLVPAAALESSFQENAELRDKLNRAPNYFVLPVSWGSASNYRSTRPLSKLIHPSPSLISRRVRKMRIYLIKGAPCRSIRTS